MKTIFLHIGTHKTGTTAVQVFGVQNAKELIKRGVYYPRAARPVIRGVSFGHHLLPWYVLKHPIPDSYWGDLASNKEIVFQHLFEEVGKSECNKILISSEEFDTLSEKQINTLRDFLSDFDVKVIVYLRRKDSYVESMYQTMVIHGQESRHISEIINRNFRCPLNYFDFVEKWRAAFGLKNVCVRLYCREALDAEDIVVDFYNRVGIDVRDLISDEGQLEVNTSVPLHYVALVAMLRRGGAGKDIVDRSIRIAKKMKGNASSGFHFLSLRERQALAESGLDELRKLNIYPDDDPVFECFRLKDSSEEVAPRKRSYEGLGRVLMDFERIITRDNRKGS